MIRPNDFFDEIFVLSIERRYNRWILLKEKLIREGIYVKTFNGVDKNSPRMIIEYKTFLQKHKTYWEWSDGNFAILRSFYNLYIHIARNCPTLEKVLILEDDILFHKNFNILFNEAINSIPQDWKLWYLGGTYWNRTHIKTINNSPFTKVKSMTGNFALALTRKTINEIIPLLFSTMQKGCLTTDIAIKRKYEMKNGVYASEPLLIAHDYGYSDTEDRLFTPDNWGHPTKSKLGRYTDLEIYH